MGTVTRDDVASRAGVSSAVVSYVVNDGPRPVSDQTRAKVLRAIDELGYYPNPAARSLKLRRSFVVGLVTPDITNPVYAEIAKGMEEILTGAGRLLMLCDSARDPVRERDQLDALSRQRVDGIALIPTGDPDPTIRRFREAATALVVLEHFVPGVPCIVVDETAAGRDSTRYLLDLGHRRIGLLRDAPDHRLSRHRFDGYRQALCEAAIPFDRSLVEDAVEGPNDGASAARRLLRLDHRPTAILAHNDLLALGAMHAAWTLGLRVPDDVNVMGYDDISVAAYLTPPLTTVSFPHREMGRKAAHILAEIDEDVWEPDESPVVLEHKVVIRGSTAARTPAQ